jgi:hypothetical protein
VGRFGDSAFEPYDLTTEQIHELRARVVAWADEIEGVGR